MAVAVSTQLLTAEVRFLSLAILVGFVVDRMALGQSFFPPVLQLFPVSIIPQMLHTHSFTHYRSYTILANERVFKITDKSF